MDGESLYNSKHTSDGATALAERRARGGSTPPFDRLQQASPSTMTPSRSEFEVPIGEPLGGGLGPLPTPPISPPFIAPSQHRSA